MQAGGTSGKKLSQALSLTLVVALVAFGLGGVYLFGITRIVVPLFADPIGARAFPTVIAFGMLISGVLLVIEHIQARKASGQEPKSEATGEAKGEAKSEDWPTLSWTVVGVAAWTAVYLAVFEFLGFLIATALYLIPLMIYFYRGRVVLNIVISVAFAVASYLSLAVALDAQLPTGTLVESLLGY